MKTKKIIKALKLVKKYCNKHEDCQKCCFRQFEYLHNVCPFRNTSPMFWDLEHLDKQLEEIKDEHLIRKVKNNG